MDLVLLSRSQSWGWSQHIIEKKERQRIKEKLSWAWWYILLTQVLWRQRQADVCEFWPACPTYGVPSQSSVYRETLSQEEKQKDSKGLMPLSFILLWIYPLSFSYLPCRWPWEAEKMDEGSHHWKLFTNICNFYLLSLQKSAPLNDHWITGLSGPGGTMPSTQGK